MSRFDATKEQLAAFKAGDRVALHPSLDDWMRGDRYGTVTKIGRKWIHVRLDWSGRTRQYHPAALERMPYRAFIDPSPDSEERFDWPSETVEQRRFKNEYLRQSRK